MSREITETPTIMTSPDEAPLKRGFGLVRGLRWWIIILVFLAAVLNYVDRQTFAALAPTIQHDLGLDDRDYGNIVNFFLLAYTISYLIAGRIADLLGTRIGMAIFVGWWSLANMVTAAARGVGSMSSFQFMLGLGEAGVWPAASKSVSEWFPARERALAIGIYTMGATVGATVAPYIVIPLAAYPFAEKMPFVSQMFGSGVGWKMAFFLTGAAGFIWLIPWLAIYGLPQKSRLIRKEELALIEEKSESEKASALDKPWTWRQVFSSKIVWLLLLARLITDPVWYFYQFWFPKYLHSDRHLSQEQLKITWVVYAAAGVGSLLGGWLSGRLINRGVAPASSRLWLMLGSAALIPLSPLIATVSGNSAALVLTIVVVLAALAWLINLSAIVVDLVPKHSLGTVFSVVAAGSTVGGMIMNLMVTTIVAGRMAHPTGFINQTLDFIFGGLLSAIQGKGYAEWFLIMGFLHPVAWLLLKAGKIDKLGKPALSVIK